MVLRELRLDAATGRLGTACGSDFFYNKVNSDYGIFHKITLDGSNVPTYAPKCKMITACILMLISSPKLKAEA